MTFSQFQKEFHYPLGQDDESSKANEMISEFPGSFCSTTYHNLFKEQLTAEGENVYPVKKTRGEFLTDLYLLVEIPVSSGMPSKAESLIQKIITSVELQWKDDRTVLQRLLSQTVDDNFRWRYRTISDFHRSSEEVNIIVVKLPWFFSKKLGNSIPMMFFGEGLKLKLNLSDTQRPEVKYNVIAEYAQISEEERNFFLGTNQDESWRPNPNRNKRVIYEELTLDQLKAQSIVTRMSWSSPDTIVEVSVDDKTKIVLDPKTCPELHWDFFGNDWSRYYQRYSYSVAATPDRAVSNILSGVQFSRINLTSIGKTEDVRFIVQKLATFTNTGVRVFP